MAEFEATVIRRLELTTLVTVRAKDEDAANDKVQAMIDDGKFGDLEWKVTGTRRDDEWEEDLNELEVQEVQ